MLRIHRVPKQPLSNLVELLWYYETPPGTRALERILPMGTVELVVDLGEDRVDLYDRVTFQKAGAVRGALIVGPQSEYAVIDSSATRAVLGVHFKPGGATPFLGIPAGELLNQTVSLDELWGDSAAYLREALLEAPTPDARLDLLEGSLLAHARGAFERPAAVGYALAQFQGGISMPSVGAVTDRLGLSPRRFIKAFRDEVGLTPKLFCRVRRFQEVVKRVHARTSIDWLEVALSCAYFDQAHFIHDFQAFAGLTPTAYLAARTPFQNHVAVTAPGD